MLNKIHQLTGKNIDTIKGLVETTEQLQVVISDLSESKDSNPYLELLLEGTNRRLGENIDLLIKNTSTLFRQIKTIGE